MRKSDCLMNRPNKRSGKIIIGLSTRNTYQGIRSDACSMPSVMTAISRVRMFLVGRNMNSKCPLKLLALNCITTKGRYFDDSIYCRRSWRSTTESVSLLFAKRGIRRWKCRSTFPCRHYVDTCFPNIFDGPGIEKRYCCALVQESSASNCSCCCLSFCPWWMESTH